MLSPRIRRSDRSTLAVDSASDTDRAKLATRVSLMLFMVCAAGRAVTFFSSAQNERWMWLDAMLVLLGTATTLIGQMRRLPAQNVLAAAGISLGFERLGIKRMAGISVVFLVAMVVIVRLSVRWR